MKITREHLSGKPAIPSDHNIYPIISIFLIVVAVILLLIALSTDRNDFTTAMLIAVSLVDFLTGIVILAFAGAGGINPKISAMLYPPLITDKAGIFSELNVYGDAHFIPESISDSGKTLQFNPAGEYTGFDYTGSHFSIKSEETAGIFTSPSSSSLQKHLEEDYGLEIPHGNESEDQIEEILKEILTETAGFCENVKISDNGEEIIVKMVNPAFINGCLETRKESPKCCTVSPCPVCAMVCSVAAEYFDKVVAVSAIRIDLKERTIMIIFRILSHQPRDEDHDSSS